MYPELHRVSTVLWVSSGGGGGADGDQGSQPDPRGVVSDHNTTPTPSPRLALPPSSALPFVGRSWMLLPFVVSFSQARTSASEHQPGVAHAPCPPCLVCLHECLPCGARLAGGLFFCVRAPYLPWLSAQLVTLGCCAGPMDRVAPHAPNPRVVTLRFLGKTLDQIESVAS